jgi:hypothetical protein
LFIKDIIIETFPEIAICLTGNYKVVPVLLTKHHAMKAFWGVDVELHSFFDLGTRWR